MSDLVHDAERILRDCFASFAEYPNATLIHDDDAFGVITDMQIAFFSGIASSRLAVDADVDRISARFRERSTPFRWWLTPLTRPVHLETLLLERRFRHVYDANGMVADLAKTPFDGPLPQGLTIRRLTNIVELEAWLDVIIPTFSRPDEERGVWREAFGFFGFEESSTWAHFVGFVEDRPVSTTSVLLAGELGGIYHVATLPQARGRGIGRAVTLAAMKHARDRGAQRAVLQSSEMGFGVYRSIGFEDVCPLRLYDWRPEYEKA